MTLLEQVEQLPFPDRMSLIASLIMGVEALPLEQRQGVALALLEATPPGESHNDEGAAAVARLRERGILIR